MATHLVNSRIKAVRKERKLSQDGLARLLGFGDRRTVSAIETGARRVAADELALAAERLGAPLDRFTDPFMLVGEGRFSWSRAGVGADALDGFERRAGGWIAAFRAVAAWTGRPAPLLRASLRLDRRSGAADATEAGERFVAEFDLGEVPASRLAEAMERGLGIPALMVDAPEGISGGACRLDGLDAVLVNRRQAAGRRHRALADGLFRALAWDALPLERAAGSKASGGGRAGKLADGFASAVLMPRAALARFGGWKGIEGEALASRLNAAAGDLRVTAQALGRRLAALGEIAPSAARRLEAAGPRDGGHAEADAPLPYSRLFMETIGHGIADGRVSTRRAAQLLERTIDDLYDLFDAYGIARPSAL